MKKNEQILREMWGAFNSNNIPIFGLSGEEKKKRAEKIRESIMAYNFLKLLKNIQLNIQEVQ